MSWKPGTVQKRRRHKPRAAASSSSSSCGNHAAGSCDLAPAAGEEEEPTQQQQQQQQRPTEQQQHPRQRPPSASNTVAVIGGGISGLSCAVRLKELGLAPTVFDTGRKAVGGRCSSRSELQQKEKQQGKGKQRAKAADGQVYRFDHSAQCMAVGPDDGEFARVMAKWADAGAVRPWAGKFGVVACSESGRPSVGAPLRRSSAGASKDGGDGGGDVAEQTAAPTLWIGTDGMESLPDHLAAGLDVVQPMWVSQVERVERGDGSATRSTWSLHGGKQHLGTFDYLVVAHNGKCAFNLMKKAKPSPPAFLPLLKTHFGQALRTPGQQTMQLCSVWVLLVALPSAAIPADSPLFDADGLFVQHRDVSWIANNRNKFAGSGSSDAHCWTLISTRDFGERHKVPQEAVPPAKAAEVEQLMLEAMEQAANVPAGQLASQVRFAKSQLWGAGIPINCLVDSPCIYEADVAVGVCGDWLSSPSIRGAAISGIRLAEAMHAGISSPAQQPRHPAPATAAAAANRGYTPNNSATDKDKGRGRRNRNGSNRGGNCTGARGRQGGGRGASNSRNVQIPKFAPSPSPPIGSFPGLAVPDGEGWGTP